VKWFYGFATGEAIVAAVFAFIVGHPGFGAFDAGCAFVDCCSWALYYA
jgi:hypothetical protein